MKSSLAHLIINPIFRKINNLVAAQTLPIYQHTEQLLILQGRMLALQNAERAPLPSISDAEFKVFSQWGEDGILQYLIRETDIQREMQIFIEFGVQNYRESCTRFLLQNDNWKGLIIDGSTSNIEFVRKSDIYWRHDLTAIDAWVDRDNVNGLFARAGFIGEIGVLVIDIDGNDYWVWERIDVVNPVIVVVEWNSLFGPDHLVSIPYDPSFNRSTAHHSCLYYGASIAAFGALADRKGYVMVGSNSAGNNLFFVRRDRLGRLKPLTAKTAYIDSRFRESRDAVGSLSFLSGSACYDEIKDLPLISLADGITTTLSVLDKER